MMALFGPRKTAALLRASRALAGAGLLAACASVEAPPARDWTEDDEAAYQQCLEDNMAVAMAWEMIEQSCREQVAGDGDAPPLQ